MTVPELNILPAHMRISDAINTIKAITRYPYFKEISSDNPKHFPASSRVVGDLLNSRNDINDITTIIVSEINILALNQALRIFNVLGAIIFVID